MGWLTMEELWWNKEGKLMTSAPSTYKIPAVNDCPADFRVRPFKNANHEDTILRSKAVGEPPLLLPFSVFFAMRDAAASVADDRVNPPLNAPAASADDAAEIDMTLRPGAASTCPPQWAASISCPVCWLDASPSPRAPQAT